MANRLATYPVSTIEPEERQQTINRLDGYQSTRPLEKPQLQTETISSVRRNTPWLMRLIAGGEDEAQAIMKANLFRNNPEQAKSIFPDDPTINYLTRSPEQSFIPNLWNTKLDGTRMYEIDNLASMTREERKNFNETKGIVTTKEFFGDLKDPREYMLFSGVLRFIKSAEYKGAVERLQSDNYNFDETGYSPKKTEDQLIVRDKLLLLEEMQDRGMTLPSEVLDSIANMAKYAGEIYLMAGLLPGAPPTTQLGKLGLGAKMAALNVGEVATLTSERMTPKGYIGDRGKYIQTKEGQALLKALPKSFLEQTATYWTEQQGEVIGKYVRGIGGKIISKLPKGLASTLIKLGKIPQPFYDAIQKGKLDGMIPELVEEYIDRIIRPTLMIDDQYRGKSQEYLERVARSFIPDGRELLVQTLTFSIMPIGGHVVGGIDYMFGPKADTEYGRALTPEELDERYKEILEPEPTVEIKAEAEPKEDVQELKELHGQLYRRLFELQESGAKVEEQQSLVDRIITVRDKIGELMGMEVGEYPFEPSAITEARISKAAREAGEEEPPAKERREPTKKPFSKMTDNEVYEIFRNTSTDSTQWKKLYAEVQKRKAKKAKVSKAKRRDRQKPEERPPEEEAGPTAVLVPPKKPLPPEEKKPTAKQRTELKEAMFETYEVPLEALDLSKDVPQFKEAADIVTGIVPGQQLKGKYRRLSTAPIVVWKRKDGRFEIVTGRHRFDLAKRTGEKTIPAQIAEEEKGFTREMALTIDAESNILDEQGSIEDYAQYFKNREIDEEEARQRGLLSRAKGNLGFLIGKSAIDNVFTGFINGKISAQKAAAIARGAPNNEAVQNAALAKAATKSAEELEQYARILTKYKTEDRLKARQGVLWGFDESAIQEAELVAKEVQKEVKAIKDRILSVKGALKRPETARKMGLEFTDEASIRKEVARLENRLDELSRTATTPELFAEMRERAGLKTEEAPPSPAVEVKKVEAVEVTPEKAKPLPKVSITERIGYHIDNLVHLFGVTRGEATAVVALWNANAKVQGMDLVKWYDIHIADIVKVMEEGLPLKGGRVLQRKKAFVEFLDDGRAILHALKGADVSSLAHETAHIFRRTLSKQDNQIAAYWSGAKDGKWTTAAEEKFARGFERYLRDGKAPNSNLQRIFEQFKVWLTNIYRTISGSPLDLEISVDIRGVFDRLLVGEEYGKAEAITKAAGVEGRPTVPERAGEVGVVGRPGGREAVEGYPERPEEAGRPHELPAATEAIVQSKNLIPETVTTNEDILGELGIDLLGRKELKGGVAGETMEFLDKEKFLTEQERERLNALRDVEGQEKLFQAEAPLDQDQLQGIRLALDSLGKGQSFLLADGAGFGKTRQIISIAQIMQKRTGKPSLIVTDSVRIINNIFKPQAKAIGVDLDKIEIGTYSGLSAGKIGLKDRYGVVIFDEAHNLKHVHSLKSQAAARIKTDTEVFATATPMDSPVASAYFLAKITGLSRERVADRLGYHFETRVSERGKPYEQAVLNSGHQWTDVIDHIIDMRNNAVSQGNLIRREIPFKGTFHDMKLSRPMDFRANESDIWAYWQQKIKRSRSAMARINYGGQRTGELSRYTEAKKIEEVYRQLLRDYKAGKKVIIVAEGVNRTSIKALNNAVFPGLLGTFAQKLQAKGIDYAQLFDAKKLQGVKDRDSSKEVARFQADDKVRIALMTPKTGGAGIDLDDSIGNDPRTMYIVTMNYSGDVWDQVMGRVSRRNTKSPPVITFVDMESMSDKRRREILDRKIRTLKAIQKGEDLDRAYGFEVTDEQGRTKVLYQAAEGSAESETPPEVQKILRRVKNLAPLTITKQTKDADALMDAYFAERNEKQKEADIDLMVYQNRLKVAMGDKEHGGWKARHQKAVEAMQVYVDLKENPEQMKYYKGLPKEKQEIVDYAQNLPGELKTLADDIIEQNKQLGLEALDVGVITNVLENYSMRLWEKEPTEFIKRKFGTKTARARHRTLEGILHGWSKGKELRIKGIFNAQKVMRHQISDTTVDRQLLKTGRSMGLISTQHLHDWKRIEHPNFTDWRWAGKAEKAKTYGKNFFVTKDGNLMERVPMYAPADLAKWLNNVFAISALYKIPGVRFATEWNARLKRFVLMAMFFHHQAYIRSYDLGGRIGFRYENMSPRKAFNAGRRAIENFIPDLRRGVRNGLTFGRIQDYDESILRGKHTLIGRMIRKAKVIDAPVREVEKLRDWNEHFLFGKLGSYLKVQAYLLEYRQLITKNREQIKKGKVTLDELAAIAADLANDDFGGLHLERKGRNPTLQHLFRLLALAPDWTESNVASAVKAFKTGQQGKVYRAFWARIAAKGIVALIVFNYLMALYDEDDETEETVNERFIANYKRAWQEGRMRWLDVDVTPIYKMLGGKANKRKYFSLLGHFKDPMKFVAREQFEIKGVPVPDVLRSLITSAKYKGSILSRIIADGLTGKNWAGREFTTFDELIGVDDKGVYKVTRPGLYKKGEPKGGKLKGELTKWSMGGVKPLGLEQVPSYLYWEAQSNMPIQVQQGINYLKGQTDAFDAILKSAGVYISSTWSPYEEIKNLPREELLRLRRRNTYRKTKLPRSKGVIKDRAHKGKELLVQEIDKLLKRK